MEAAALLYVVRKKLIEVTTRPAHTAKLRVASVSSDKRTLTFERLPNHDSALFPYSVLQFDDPLLFRVVTAVDLNQKTMSFRAPLETFIDPDVVLWSTRPAAQTAFIMGGSQEANDLVSITLFGNQEESLGLGAGPGAFVQSQHLGMNIQCAAPKGAMITEAGLPNEAYSLWEARFLQLTEQATRVVQFGISDMTRSQMVQRPAVRFFRNNRQGQWTLRAEVDLVFPWDQV